MNLESLLHSRLNQVFKDFGVEHTADHSDNTPMGEEWNADYIITHPVSKERLVVQTLWFDGKNEDQQRQEIEEVFTRNQLYLSSGYKTLWLIEQPETDQGFIRHLLQEQLNVTMPMFYFTTDDADEPEFYVGGWRSNAEQERHFFAEISNLQSGGQFELKHHFNRDGEIHYLPLFEFLKYFFVGAICWSFEEIETSISLALVERKCWKCHTPQNLVKTVNIIGSPLEGQPVKTVLYYSSLSYAPISEDMLFKLNRPEMRKKYNYGEIKYRYSKTINDEYLSTGCVKCGALQGQHFIDMITLNPQEYTHTELMEGGLLKFEDQTAYETMGEWINLQNEFLEIHQHRNLES